MVKHVGIVSLSSGILGEGFVRHEIEIGMERLTELGIEVTVMPNSGKGIQYVKDHPEKRAEDLISAYSDPSIDMILCAIGGDDTYRLLPYLFDNDEFKKVVNNKIFLGFSDTTMNHFMLHKLGINSFYGQSFVADICEIDKDMLPYSRKYFEELVATESIAEITPSEIWYEDRESYSPECVGTPRKSHRNDGFQLLQGRAVFEGTILGGCVDTIYDIFDNERYSDSVALCEKYRLFPNDEEWKGKILLLETSEEKPTPQKYERCMRFLKERGVFKAVNGILCGKPMDEMYKAEYCEILKKVIDNPELPVVTNINIGHAAPRCIIPFGINAVVDVEKQKISFNKE